MSTGHNRLATLAGEIAEHHRAAGAATREVIRHAIEAGRRLAEAKALVAHGEWLPWLRANVPGISPRTAQRYLAAAHHAGESDTVSFFRLRDLARRPRPSMDDRIDKVIDGLGRYKNQVLAATTSETFRAAQNLGLCTLDELGGIARDAHARATAAIIATGADLAAVKERLPAERWSQWLAAEFQCSPEIAAEFIQAYEHPEHAPVVMERLAEELAA